MISVLVFLGIIIGIIAMGVILIVVMMHPPAGDLTVLALLLSVSGALSALVGFVSWRLGFWRRFGRLSRALTAGYVIAAALTLANVWLTARLMFNSGHDLALAAVLLIFASGISIAFGSFISVSISQAIMRIVGAADRLREGDFSARVDVTGRDEIADMARAFNEMAADLEAMEREKKALDYARRNLISWASHDLRTPLTSLRAMIDSMVDGVVDDPVTVARYLEQSQREITNMSRLIDDLFELARLDAGDLTLDCQFSSLSDLVSDTLAAFAARASANDLTLDGAVAPEVDPLWMAPDKINRVLYNLMDNAFRHTPEGGTIRLEAAVENGSVAIAVRDSGDGIPADDLPFVFDSFYRGEKSRSREGYSAGGAGLGLAIARRLVEAHGGRIWAESQSGQGTTMRFLLPRTPDTPIHN